MIRKALLSAIENAMFARMLRSGGAAQPQRVGNARQLVGHERDVGGLERGVGAGDAHRDADVGGGERRRVVDAVADHRQRAVARAQLLDRRHLVLGQQVGAVVVETERLGERRAAAAA